MLISAPCIQARGELIEAAFMKLLSCMQDVTYRKVLHDDKKGRQKVEVEQLAAWKFLMFSGSFATRPLCLSGQTAAHGGCRAAASSHDISFTCFDHILEVNPSCAHVPLLQFQYLTWLTS